MKYSAPVMGTGKKKIAVGMSGGVDSSITAYLLKQQGHEVVGIMMAIWAGDPSWKVPDGNACYNPNEGQEVKEASAFAEKIGIPFHVFDLKKEYQKTVLDRFVSGYLEGQTPNPCVICNHQMKFGSLFEAAQKNLDFDCFATGHYVQVQQAENGGRHLLKKGIDAKKDQSYFLYRLKQEQLAKTLCPLGGYEKKEVWKISDELGLKFHGESQDFIAGKDYSVLFKTGKEPGPILDATGKEIGQHNGIIHYTIGQRKGINTLSNERLYVSAIEPQTNTIRVDLKEKLFFADV
ncbi:MAG: tRNA 2-thiouridine(34) synthase MnmA, partial [bacterium]|nr:tRNA 2-thiouridine(34) synthase MnmA [bacterium]